MFKLYNRWNRGQLQNPTPQQKDLIDKIRLFLRHKYIVDDCLRMIDTENGNILHLFVSGGFYDQPEFELRILYMVQGYYREALSKAREQESKKSKHK